MGERLVALGMSKGPFQFPPFPLRGSSTSLAPNYSGNIELWRKNVDKFPVQKKNRFTGLKGAASSVSTSTTLSSSLRRPQGRPFVPNTRPPARRPPPKHTKSNIFQRHQDGDCSRASASVSNATTISDSIACSIGGLEKQKHSSQIQPQQQPQPQPKKKIISPAEVEDVAKLKLELHRCRLDNEASDRRIARLVRKVEELEYAKEEVDNLKVELEELDEQLHSTVLENSDLKKRISLEGRGSKDSIKEGFTKEERNTYVVKIKELSTQIEALTGNYKNMMKQMKTFQQEVMDALGITDTDLSRCVANGGIGESSKSCGSVKLHGFLRTCVENLKSEQNGSLHEISTLRSQLHQEAFKKEALEKEVDTLQAERKRAIEGFRDHESQIAYLSNEIKLLRSFLNDELGKETEAQIKTLQIENNNLNQALGKLRTECDTIVDKFQTDLQHEHDRYDQLEALGVEERKEMETRWKKLWEAHAYRMQEDIETLKKNYERPLMDSHERETALQNQLDELHARYNRSKEAWEEYRLNLFEQLEQWKEQYILKGKLLDELREERKQIDADMEEKQKDIELYQSMLNDGVEERQNLQKKVEALQIKLRELIGLTTEPVNGESINLGILPSSRSWFSIGDFKKMKEKMQSKSQSLLAAHQQEEKEKKKLHS